MTNEEREKHTKYHDQAQKRANRTGKPHHYARFKQDPKTGCIIERKYFDPIGMTEDEQLALDKQARAEKGEHADILEFAYPKA